MPRQPTLNPSKRFGWNSTINKKRYYFGHDKVEARKRFIDTLNKHHKGEILSNDTVAKLIDDYLAYKVLTVSESTYDWNARPLEDFQRYIGPKKKISTLSKSDLELFLAKHWTKRRDGKPLSASSLKQAKRSIKSCFAWLTDNRKISFNPFSTLVVGSADSAKNIPNEEQIAAIIKHFEHDQDLIDLIQFEALTGARVFEARSIRCEQVKLKENKIVLDESQTKSYARLKEKRLRTILLNPDAKVIVERNLAKHENSGLLFQNPLSLHSDSRWHPNTISMRFRRAKKHLGFHIVHRTIRHFFATSFLKAGGNVAAGAAILGHANPTMLLTNYQKIYNDHDYLLEQANIVTANK